MSFNLTGMEMVGPSKRMWAGVIIEYFFAIGLLILTGIGYLVRDWNYFEMAIAFPNLIYIIYFWYVYALVICQITRKPECRTPAANTDRDRIAQRHNLIEIFTVHYQVVQVSWKQLEKKQTS